MSILGTNWGKRSAARFILTMADQTNFGSLSLLLWQSVTDTEWAEKLERGAKMSLLCI